MSDKRPGGAPRKLWGSNAEKPPIKISVVLPGDLVERIERVSKITNTRISSVIRDLLAAGLEKEIINCD